MTATDRIANIPTAVAPDEDIWVTTTTAARILGVHSKTVSRQIKEGKLKGVRVQQTIGGHARIHLGDLRALVATLDSAERDGGDAE